MNKIILPIKFAALVYKIINNAGEYFKEIG
jgi:hypothetical protein